MFALDAESGEELWRFDPNVSSEEPGTRTCRGVAAWRDPSRAAGERCALRLFSGTVDARLIALDARDGVPCPDFGSGAGVDLRTGLGAVQRGEYRVTSPPTVIGDVVAVGALVADGRSVDAPGGVVRGFHARSGALRWSWDPTPDARERAMPGFARGTPNAWSIFSADPERDLLFVPTGNPSPDFFGGLRRRSDHYGSSVVALRGSTGELVWHFQTVHHDLWDYDVSAQPTLLEVELAGRRVPALLQATKMGHLFLLERTSGAPLYPVEERPVPQGGVPGESLAPTQPFRTHPPALHPARLEPDDAWGLTPFDRAACRSRIEALRSDGIFTPPSLEGSVVFPGVAGGVNWGGVAFDPARRIVVLNQNRIANVVTLVPQERVDPSDVDPPRKILFPQRGAPYAAKQEVLVSPLGIPCTRPPWGTLLALDLDRGELLWERPLGTTRDLAPFPFWFEWGLPSMGGPLATASGLVFIGASLDDYLRAFDLETGEELWRVRLPAGGQATPITYRLERASRQYVVIAAGGHATLGTTPGEWLLAYALPAGGP